MLLAKSGGASSSAYIEDVFSTYLYTSTGSNQNIVNGIDLAGKGGLVWEKVRNSTGVHFLEDTARGTSGGYINTASTAPQGGGPAFVQSFNSDGFTVNVGASALNTVAWTFRKQPKFFDVVTWTGNGVSGRTVAHSLGSAPGCVIIKSTSDAFDWYVYHQSLGTGNFLNLNSTAVATASEAMFGPGNPAPSSTVVTLGNSNATNGNGKTYVAYLFAHNAGGFGLTGTDNVITCDYYIGNGSANGPVVNLGYEPQWLLIKKTGSSGGAWWITDTMRGFSVTSDQFLWANSATNEIPKTNYVKPTATGFQIVNADFDVNESGEGYIYIAIRRGPMKTPTSGTSVYNAVTWTGNNTTGRTLAHGLSSPPDLSITQWRDGDQINLLWDKLRGFSTTASGDSVYLRTPSTGGESLLGDYYYIPDMVNVAFGSVAGGSIQLNSSSSTLVGWNFRRAPGFMDEVCYSGTGSATTVSHNLGVAPELMIFKSRSAAGAWPTFSALTSTSFNSGELNSTIAFTPSGYSSGGELSAAPTSTTFSLGGSSPNNSGTTYVAYLFASCPGVSKCGSYTGTGTTQQINCGFTAGARFVLIKRTDSTGDWYVWDTARGIVSANDPRLSLNSTAAEVTTDDSVDPAATGFTVNQDAATNINVSSGTYIYLAIA